MLAKRENAAIEHADLISLQAPDQEPPVFDPPLQDDELPVRASTATKHQFNNKTLFRFKGCNYNNKQYRCRVLADGLCKGLGDVFTEAAPTHTGRPVLLSCPGEDYAFGDMTVISVHVTTSHVVCRSRWTTRQIMAPLHIQEMFLHKYLVEHVADLRTVFNAHMIKDLTTIVLQFMEIVA